MKAIELLENPPAIDKKQIRLLLKQHFVTRGTVTISDEGIVSVAGEVILMTKIKITELPVKFGKVTGDFVCQDNQLKSLSGGPSNVSGYFDCRNNQLKSLADAPSYVGGYFNCARNQLTSLAGAPSYVGKYFYCRGNQLESLAGLPATINDQLYVSYNTNLPLLRTLNVTGITGIIIDNNQEVANILNKHLPQGRAGIMPCAAELIKAGYKGNARL